MDRQDYEILEDMIEIIDRVRQRRGGNPQRSNLSSSRKLRMELSDYADKCRRGELKGRARKRKSGELFRRIVAGCPDWSK